MAEEVDNNSYGGGTEVSPRQDQFLQKDTNQDLHRALKSHVSISNVILQQEISNTISHFRKVEETNEQTSELIIKQITSEQGIEADQNGSELIKDYLNTEVVQNFSNNQKKSIYKSHKSSARSQSFTNQKKNSFEKVSQKQTDLLYQQPQQLLSIGERAKRLFQSSLVSKQLHELSKKQGIKNNLTQDDFTFQSYSESSTRQLTLAKYLLVLPASHQSSNINDKTSSSQSICSSSGSAQTQKTFPMNYNPNKRTLQHQKTLDGIFNQQSTLQQSSKMKFYRSHTAEVQDFKKINEKQKDQEGQRKKQQRSNEQKKEIAIDFNNNKGCVRDFVSSFIISQDDNENYNRNYKRSNGLSQERIKRSQSWSYQNQSFQQQRISKRNADLSLFSVIQQLSNIQTSQFRLAAKELILISVDFIDTPFQELITGKASLLLEQFHKIEKNIQNKMEKTTPTTGGHHGPGVTSLNLRTHMQEDDTHRTSTLSSSNSIADNDTFSESEPRSNVQSESGSPIIGSRILELGMNSPQTQKNYQKSKFHILTKKSQEEKELLDVIATDNQGEVNGVYKRKRDIKETTIMKGQDSNVIDNNHQGGEGRGIINPQKIESTVSLDISSANIPQISSNELKPLKATDLLRQEEQFIQKNLSRIKSCFDEFCHILNQIKVYDIIFLEEDMCSSVANGNNTNNILISGRKSLTTQSKHIPRLGETTQSSRLIQDSAGELQQQQISIPNQNIASLQGDETINLSKKSDFHPSKDNPNFSHNNSSVFSEKINNSQRFHALIQNPAHQKICYDTNLPLLLIFKQIQGTEEYISVQQNQPERLEQLRKVNEIIISSHSRPNLLKSNLYNLKRFLLDDCQEFNYLKTLILHKYSNWKIKRWLASFKRTKNALQKAQLLESIQRKKAVCRICEKEILITNYKKHSINCKELQDLSQQLKGQLKEMNQGLFFFFQQNRELQVQHALIQKYLDKMLLQQHVQLETRTKCGSPQGKPISNETNSPHSTPRSNNSNSKQHSPSLGLGRLSPQGNNAANKYSPPRIKKCEEIEMPANPDNQTLKITANRRYSSTGNQERIKGIEIREELTVMSKYLMKNCNLKEEIMTNSEQITTENHNKETLERSSSPSNKLSKSTKMANNNSNQIHNNYSTSCVNNSMLHRKFAKNSLMVIQLEPAQEESSAQEISNSQPNFFTKNSSSSSLITPITSKVLINDHSKGNQLEDIMEEEVLVSSPQQLTNCNSVNNNNDEVCKDSKSGNKSKNNNYIASLIPSMKHYKTCSINKSQMSINNHPVFCRNNQEDGSAGCLWLSSENQQDEQNHCPSENQSQHCEDKNKSQNSSLASILQISQNYNGKEPLRGAPKTEGLLNRIKTVDFTPKEEIEDVQLSQTAENKVSDSDNRIISGDLKPRESTCKDEGNQEIEEEERIVIPTQKQETLQVQQEIVKNLSNSNKILMAKQMQFQQEGKENYFATQKITEESNTMINSEEIRNIYHNNFITEDSGCDTVNNVLCKSKGQQIQEKQHELQHEVKNWKEIAQFSSTSLSSSIGEIDVLIADFFKTKDEKCRKIKNRNSNKNSSRSASSLSSQSASKSSISSRSESPEHLKKVNNNKDNTINICIPIPIQKNNNPEDQESQWEFSQELPPVMVNRNQRPRSSKDLTRNVNLNPPEQMLQEGEELNQVPFMKLTSQTPNRYQSSKVNDFTAATKGIQGDQIDLGLFKDLQIKSVVSEIKNNKTITAPKSSVANAIQKQQPSQQRRTQNLHRKNKSDSNKLILPPKTRELQRLVSLDCSSNGSNKSSSQMQSQYQEGSKNKDEDKSQICLNNLLDIKGTAKSIYSCKSRVSLIRMNTIDIVSNELADCFHSSQQQQQLDDQQDNNIKIVDFNPENSKEESGFSISNSGNEENINKRNSFYAENLSASQELPPQIRRSGLQRQKSLFGQKFSRKLSESLNCISSSNLMSSECIDQVPDMSTGMISKMYKQQPLKSPCLCNTSKYGHNHSEDCTFYQKNSIYRSNENSQENHHVKTMSQCSSPQSSSLSQPSSSSLESSSQSSNDSQSPLKDTKETKNSIPENVLNLTKKQSSKKDKRRGSEIPSSQNISKLLLESSHKIKNLQQLNLKDTAHNHENPHQIQNHQAHNHHNQPHNSTQNAQILRRQSLPLHLLIDIRTLSEKRSEIQKDVVQMSMNFEVKIKQHEKYQCQTKLRVTNLVQSLGKIFIIQHFKSTPQQKMHALSENQQRIDFLLKKISICTFKTKVIEILKQFQERAQLIQKMENVEKIVVSTSTAVSASKEKSINTIRSTNSNTNQATNSDSFEGDSANSQNNSFHLTKHIRKQGRSGTFSNSLMFKPIEKDISQIQKKHDENGAENESNSEIHNSNHNNPNNGCVPSINNFFNNRLKDSSNQQSPMNSVETIQSPEKFETRDKTISQALKYLQGPPQNSSKVLSSQQPLSLRIKPRQSKQISLLNERRCSELKMNFDNMLSKQIEHDEDQRIGKLDEQLYSTNGYSSDGVIDNPYSSSNAKDQNNKEKSSMSIENFQFLKLISKGAFGRVWLVRKKNTEDIYAMKIVNFAEKMNKNHLESLKKENDILSKVQGDYVVKAVYTFTHESYICFVMEYMLGGDLGSIILTYGVLEESVARFYIAEIILAVHNLHAIETNLARKYLLIIGIIHRDLKPDNLLLDSHGHLKLSDFGLSDMGLKRRNNTESERKKHKLKILTNLTTTSKAFPKQILSSEGYNNYFNSNSTNSPQKTTNNSNFNSYNLSNKSPSSKQQLPKELLEMKKNVDSLNILKINNKLQKQQQTNRIIGTPDYIAPEILRGEGLMNPAIDWWSVGVLLFELLIGIPPFNDESVEKVFENIKNNRVPWDEIPVGDGEDEVSLNAINLMKRLMNPNPKLRLGSNGVLQIQQDPFFKGIDWANLKQTPAPILPAVKNILDTSNFNSNKSYADNEYIDPFFGLPNGIEKVNEAKKLLDKTRFAVKRYDVLFEENQRHIEKEEFQMKKMVQEITQQEKELEQLENECMEEDDEGAEEYDNPDDEEEEEYEDDQSYDENEELDEKQQRNGSSGTFVSKTEQLGDDLDYGEDRNQKNGPLGVLEVDKIKRQLGEIELAKPTDGLESYHA